MRLEEHEEADGSMKVWLNQNEADHLMEVIDETIVKIAIGLGLRCGLRCKEILEVRPKDIATTEGCRMVRVQSGKGDKYRETPCPESLAATISAYTDVSDTKRTDEIVDVTTRTVQRWVNRESRKAMRAEEGHNDEAWKYLSPHDLRRSWGTILVGSGVEPSIVMSWGGWSDWPTFRKHYLGAQSIEMQMKEMEKVDWL